MTTLIELHDMLAKADGPSRELDAAVCVALGIPGKPKNIYKRGFYDQNGPVLLRVETRYPAITSSIDASLALVERSLPGWKWEIGHPFWEGGIVVCRIARPGATDWASSLVESEDAPTAPLAILLALVEALIEKEKVDD